MTALFAGRYELVELLGATGNGEVHRGFDHFRQMEVALKLFLTASAQPIHAYWEASLLTSLRSDNILEVFDTGTSSDDIPYLATAIAAAGTTADRAKLAPLGIRPDLVLLWLRQALIGLRTCHARGLLHRDIKPSNIFLQRSDWALIGDFGLARLVGPDGRAAAAGTPVTKAPELFLAGTMDVRSDLYSLGVTAYLLLVGDWPFSDSDAKALGDKIVAGRFVPLRHAAPHVSGRLSKRISKAMALDPDQRYANAELMLAALSVSGLVDPAWERIAAHQDHLQCWLEVRRASGQLRQVCVEPAGTGRWNPVVRYARSGNRVAGAFATDVRTVDLATGLSAIFARL